MQSSIRLCTPQPCSCCVLLSSLAGLKYKAAVWSSGCALSLLTIWSKGTDQWPQRGWRGRLQHPPQPSTTQSICIHLYTSTLLKRAFLLLMRVSSPRCFQTQRWGFLTLFSLWQSQSCHLYFHGKSWSYIHFWSYSLNLLWCNRSLYNQAPLNVILKSCVRTLQ